MTFTRKITVLLTYISVFAYFAPQTTANPDAKRLYDDLLSNYNRLIRPVSNNTDTILVKLGLRLSQLIELVSNNCPENNIKVCLFLMSFLINIALNISLLCVCSFFIEINFSISVFHSVWTAR